MESAYRVLQQLDPAARRRAVHWLVDALDTPAVLPEIPSDLPMPSSPRLPTPPRLHAARRRRPPAPRAAGAGATTTWPVSSGRPAAVAGRRQPRSRRHRKTVPATSGHTGVCRLSTRFLPRTSRWAPSAGWPSTSASRVTRPKAGLGGFAARGTASARAPDLAIVRPVRPLALTAIGAPGVDQRDDVPLECPRTAPILEEVVERAAHPGNGRVVRVDVRGGQQLEGDRQPTPQRLGQGLLQAPEHVGREGRVPKNRCRRRQFCLGHHGHERVHSLR